MQNLQDDNHLDNLSRKAAEDFQPDQGLHSWEKLSARLDDALPQKKERKRRFLIILFLFLLVGGGITVSAILLNRQQEGNAQQTGKTGQSDPVNKTETSGNGKAPAASATDDTDSKTASSSATTEKTSGGSTTGSGETTDKSLTPAGQPAQAPKDQQTVTPSEKPQGHSAHNIPAGVTASDKQTTQRRKDTKETDRTGVNKTRENAGDRTVRKQSPDKVRKTNHPDKATAVTDQSDKTRQPDKTGKTTDATVRDADKSTDQQNKSGRTSTDKETATDKSSDKSSDKTTDKASDKAPEKPVENTSGDKQTDDQNKSDKPPANDNRSAKPSAKNSKQIPPLRNRWEFGLTYAPDVSTVRFTHTQQPGHNIGLTVGYNLSRRLSLQTGLIYTTKNYKSRGSDYHPPKGYWTDYVKLETVTASCNMWDIPLNLRYNLLPRKKSNFFVSTGLSSYLMKKEDYDFFYYYNGTPVTRYRSMETDSRHWMSVLNLSVAYERQIGKNLSLQAEPFFKQPLGGVGFGNVKLNTTGVYFTLKYKPLSGRLSKK